MPVDYACMIDHHDDMHVACDIMWKAAALAKKNDDSYWGYEQKAAMLSAVANRQWTQQRLHAVQKAIHPFCMFCLRRVEDLTTNQESKDRSGPGSKGTDVLSDHPEFMSTK